MRAKLQGRLINRVAFAFVMAACVVIVPLMQSHAGLDEANSPVPSARAAKVLDKYNRTGETVTCLNLRRINQIRPLDDRHFLVSLGSGTHYLNIVSKACRGASRSNNRIQYTTSIGQLCQNEIINVIDNTSGIFMGSCGLGAFEKLEKKSEQSENTGGH